MLLFVYRMSISFTPNLLLSRFRLFLLLTAQVKQKLEVERVRLERAEAAKRQRQLKKFGVSSRELRASGQRNRRTKWWGEECRGFTRARKEALLAPLRGDCELWPMMAQLIFLEASPDSQAAGKGAKEE